MRIDSHHHLWKYDPVQYPWIDESKLAIKRDFSTTDLEQAMSVGGIDKVISVQARQSLVETEWLLDLADNHSFVAGVVGWVPLRDRDLARTLAEFAGRPKLRGVRHVVQDEPDDDFILGDDFHRGVSLLAPLNLVYDVLIFARHLPQTIRFVDRHPHQVFVLDHIAKPSISSKQFDTGWSENICELAKRPNVACKFSGVLTEVRDPDWSIDVIRPYWDVVLQAFGPDRLMFGSDWPVSLLRANYGTWINVVEELAAPLTPSESNAFWSKTASRVYSLA